MSINKYIKLIFILTIIFGLTSCVQEKESDHQTTKKTDNLQDTVIVRRKHILNTSYEVEFTSKLYSYNWVVGKDTLDFVVNSREYVKDSTLHISVHHKNPILFATALTKIKECYPIIENDFYLSKLSSFYFKEPIYYFDLTKELSTEYEQQFGQKTISYEKLNSFLLNSKLTQHLDNFVKSLDKKTKLFSIEKFHLMNKKYFDNYLSNIDLTDYPEFTIHGMGLYVQLENK